jgi:hypothetical protein
VTQISRTKHTAQCLGILSGKRYSDCKHVADDIAFYNFFLRPGLAGLSLTVSDQDVKFANEAFREHHQALKPTGIVFLSQKAYEYFDRAESFSVPLIVTPHPGTVGGIGSCRNTTTGEAEIFSLTSSRPQTGRIIRIRSERSAYSIPDSAKKAMDIPILNDILNSQK